METQFTFTPIGYIHTQHTEKYTAPHQPQAHGKLHTGQIILQPHSNYEQALQDISGFERIWVVWVFHTVTGWKPKVLTPRHSEKHGVFATRSPHRPNPIGITVVELVDIHKLTLTIRGTDMLDGTPVLDIKPYIPQHDSFPGSSIGWLQTVEDAVPHTITWQPLAQAQANWLAEHCALPLHNTITAKLQYHPYPTSYNRVQQTGNNTYTMSYQTWRIDYTIHEDMQIHIHCIRSCYTPEQLDNPQPTDINIPQHRAFYDAWNT